MTPSVKLYGTPLCRRYIKMRELVIAEAAKIGMAIQLEEIGDTESLSKINPLSLPRLYIGDQLVASQNPPNSKMVADALEKSLTNS